MPLTKLRILTDRMTGADRRFSLRALVILSTVPLFGVVAAFGLSPNTQTLDLAPETITEALVLPSLAQSSDAVAYSRESVIQRGDSLASVLIRLDIDDLDIQRLLATEPVRQMASNIRAGNLVRAETGPDGALRSIQFERASAPTLQIQRNGDAFLVTEQEAIEETRVIMRSGRILSSLYGATDSAGIPDRIADQMADTFSTQIDFREDLRRGDTFSVIYTVNYRNGEPVGVGQLLAAEFVNAGKPYRAVLFRDTDGSQAFYTPEGESLDEGFLRSPLEFSRVTSSFSNSRRHPVYGFHRAHTGVDFGAPTGTRVKATSDGVVGFAGHQGGYGNLIILRHANGYETYYAHLSAFAEGIRPGRSVSQRQIIGFVGATGTATGPHLHYEVRINGRPYNPMTVELPGAPPLAAADRPRFLEQTAGWSNKLTLLRGTNLAALD